MKKLLLSISILFFVPNAKAQLTINDTLTTSQITTLLEGIGVTVSNLTVNCPPLAMGEFNGTSEMAITHGLVMTSGLARSAADSASAFATNCASFPGDPDLTALAGITTNDACVLEFDCTPAGDTLLFNFSFGSEEYPEYVFASFNDVFAIFLSGPGITSPMNVATIPGSIPVAIDNVNATTNSTYYYDNQIPAGQYVAYDGFTTNLTAFAEVIPGGLYHFKVAIADASDCQFDSGVFLEAFSFRSVSAGATNIKDNEFNYFSIYPNPANDVFTLYDKKNKLNGKTMKIQNVLGEQIIEEKITGAETLIDLSNYPSGIYLVNVYTGSSVISKKVVIN